MLPVVRPLLVTVLKQKLGSVLYVLPHARAGVPSIIHWRSALEDYFKRHSVRSDPFSLRTLAPSTPSIQELPERMRLIGGAEIDHIGTHCYAVPASGYSVDVAISPQFARVMQAMQPLFAHEVPCNPGSRKTLEETFGSSAEFVGQGVRLSESVATPRGLR